MASAELFNKKPMDKEPMDKEPINKKPINKRGLNKSKGDTAIKPYIKLSAMFLILFKGFDSTSLFDSRSRK